MSMLAIVCLIAALLSMLFAVVYQRRDLRPGRGGSMGGEMTAGLIWLVAALLGAVGSLAFIAWYFSLLVFFGTVALSFLVRIAVARTAR